jgi:FKBP-type peptidyl-prolyl cis-trans isomerase
MNRSLIPLAIAASLLLAGCEQKAADQPTGDQALDTDAAKISYIMGVNIGSQMKADQFQLDSGAFLRGVEDMMAGKPPQLSDEEANAVVKSYQEKRQAAHEEERKKAATANQAEGQKYLAENAKREGVTVLPSGLQYRVVTKGNGKAPAASDTVEVHYRGTLIDGTEFDSSYARNKTETFGVSQVIPGWTEALQLMHEGDKWELAIPSDLAYGPGGSGGVIGPNQVLLFEVELIKVTPEKAPAESQ